MALQYITKQGDTVDYIVWKQYGSTDNKIVEQILLVNNGLAEAGPILPAGMTVIFPEIKPQQTKMAKVKLWE